MENPFAADIINNSGYQVSQSLFALGSGGLMGTGLYQGYPNKIPIVDNDFVFSAIGERIWSNIRNTSDSCMFKLFYFILKYGNGTEQYV